MQPVPPGAAAAGLASAAAGMGRWAEAVRWWEVARQEAPQRTELLYPYGVALLKAGRREEALALWEEALRRGERRPELLNDLAWALYEERRDLGRAEALAREALGAKPDPDTADTLLRILLARGRRAAADSLVRELAPSWPESLRAWRSLLEGGKP
jgi:tetratricopeptide (TPR) repeat protein